MAALLLDSRAARMLARTLYFGSELCARRALPLNALGPLKTECRWWPARWARGPLASGGGVAPSLINTCRCPEIRGACLCACAVLLPRVCTLVHARLRFAMPPCRQRYRRRPRLCWPSPFPLLRPVDCPCFVCVCEAACAVLPPTRFVFGLWQLALHTDPASPACSKWPLCWRRLALPP